MSGNELLDDILNDLRGERKFLKKLCAFLCAVIVVLISGIIFTSVYNQWKIFDFIGETEFESTIDINNDYAVNNSEIYVK